MDFVKILCQNFYKSTSEKAVKVQFNPHFKLHFFNKFFFDPKHIGAWIENKICSEKVKFRGGSNGLFWKLVIHFFQKFCHKKWQNPAVKWILWKFCVKIFTSRLVKKLLKKQFKTSFKIFFWSEHFYASII